MAVKGELHPLAHNIRLFTKDVKHTTLATSGITASSAFEPHLDNELGIDNPRAFILRADTGDGVRLVTARGADNSS